MSLKLNVIVGSTRPGRAGLTIGHWLEGQAKAHGGFEVELVDLASFNLPLLDEAAHPMQQAYEHAHTRAWSKSVKSADAFLFLTPEYDYFPSAAIINAIQCLFLEWNYKPAGVVSYAGISGGLRAGQVLRQLLTSVNMFPLTQSVPIPNYGQHVGDDGAFRPTEIVDQGVKVLLDDLQRVAEAMKGLRA